MGDRERSDPFLDPYDGEDDLDAAVGERTVAGIPMALEEPSAASRPGKPARRGVRIRPQGEELRPEDEDEELGHEPTRMVSLDAAAAAWDPGALPAVPPSTPAPRGVRVVRRDDAPSGTGAGAAAAGPAAASAPPAQQISPPPPSPMAPSSNGMVGGVSAAGRAAWVPGAIVGSRYKLIKVLGRGGMGDVVLADDLFLRRKVAIKTLRSSLADDEVALEGFRQEVAMAHSVSHPGLARTFDLGEAAGVSYLTMEYLAGTSLWEEVHKKGPLSIKELRRVGLEVAAAMYAAHQAGVVHRDLKPSNIQLTPDRGAVVMDFGLAAAIDQRNRGSLAELGRSEYLQPSTSSAGTPHYMAPEQWRAEHQDSATDIYAFGCILFEALTGRTPFVAEDRVAMMVAHLEAKPPSLRSLRADVPADLDRLVARCMEKDPKRRPRTMLEVARALAPRKILPHLVTAALALGVVGALLLGGWTLWITSRALLLREIRPAAQRLAEITALRLDLDDLHRVRQAGDIETEPFQRSWTVLQEIKHENPEVRYVYTLRMKTPPALWEFVVDADPKDVDRNGNGEIEEDEQGSPPAMEYEAEEFPAMARVYEENRPTSDQAFKTDAWGISLSGYAPVRPRAGRSAPSDEFYIVGVDVANEPLLRLRRVLYAVFGGLGLISAGLVVLLRRRKFEHLPGFGRPGTHARA